MTFHERLTAAMERKEVSQATLAQHLDVSAASVSSWCSGAKRPTDVGRLQEIAEFLGVSPGHLQFGEDDARVPSSGGSEAERREYLRELCWYWRPAPRDRGRQFGNAAAYAFESDIRTLARESAQNISDERLATALTVDARYVVGELTGSALDDFLNAIKFDEIRPHLESASKANRKAGSVIERGLDEVNSGRLRYIRIEDYDASGLTGPEFGEGRYMAVVRNVLDSQKGDTAGGSYGLGWATLPATSQFGLVLCNSHLSIPVDGRAENRFVGVIDLPWHQLGKDEFAGRGWYGLPDPADEDTELRPTVSCWGNRALTADALVQRPTHRPGTSFLIVGAYDASGVADEIDEMAALLSESLADSFWPAMVDASDADIAARLRVMVRAERNGDRVSENFVNPLRYQLSKTKAFLKHLADDVVDSLEEPGDVVRRAVTLRVPSRHDEPRHKAQNHDAVLLVSEVGEDEAAVPNSASDRITKLRGSHMVVSVTSAGTLPLGARAFHAIVLAGEAAGDSPADRAADRFLRAAEPPAHNRWIGTPEVKASYARGAVAALSEFDEKIKQVVREIIRQPNRSSSDGPEALKELIRIQPPTVTGRRPRVRDVQEHKINDEGAWVITEATVRLPPRANGRGWTFSPVLRFGTESGAPIPVEWASIEAVRRCQLGEGGRFVSPPSARTATFSAVTDPSTHPVAAWRAKILLDVRVHNDEVAQ